MWVKISKCCAQKPYLHLIKEYILMQGYVIKVSSIIHGEPTSWQKGNKLDDDNEGYSIRLLSMTWFQQR